MLALRLLPIKFDVSRLVNELSWSPELWDDFDLRTNHPQSPHREMGDIFVRYNARMNFNGDRQTFNAEHESVWWDAAARLPAAAEIVFDLMRFVHGERLGMVLITRQPAKATCYPHVDNGWHAQHYDKYAVQLQSAQGQFFHSQRPGETPISLETAPGDVFYFDNAVPHWVTNPTEHGRMTMIVCIRNQFTGKRT